MWLQATQTGSSHARPPQCSPTLPGKPRPVLQNPLPDGPAGLEAPSFPAPTPLRMCWTPIGQNVPGVPRQAREPHRLPHSIPPESTAHPGARTLPLHGFSSSVLFLSSHHHTSDPSVRSVQVSPLERSGKPLRELGVAMATHQSKASPDSAHQPHSPSHHLAQGEVSGDSYPAE